MKLQPVTFRSAGLTLSGGLSLPAGVALAPCVVMVHGSGPQDRDGNISGFRTDILRDIADDLAARGIATLRYDKRGCGRSEGRFDTAGLLDLVGDAQAAVDRAAGLEGVDPGRIFVLGHSEGATLCPEICLGRNSVAGAIMLSASVRSLEEDLIKNAEVLNRDLETLKGLKGWLARRLFFTRDPQAMARSLRRRVDRARGSRIWVSFHRVSVKFYRETFAYDVKRHLARFHKPILAIGGGKDFQCLAEDTQRIAELAPGQVTVRVFPDMNHMLRSQEGPPSLLTYKAEADEPVLAEVKDAIAGWVEAQPRST